MIGEKKFLMGFMMDKKEYIIRQLGRTKNKKYEAYVVTRIIHLLNDFDIKFATQQYIKRDKGKCALTDLYFPQLDLHIEVDEEHHSLSFNIEDDIIREKDIVNVTGHEIRRVDVTKNFKDINSKIDEIVKEIREIKKLHEDNNKFIPWNISEEFNPATYIKLGNIDIANNVAFKTIKDACNCFGHNYSGYQQADASHPEHDILLWFPKLFLNKGWDNQINNSETVITEKCKDKDKLKEHVRSHIENTEKFKQKRIVFAKVRDNLGVVLYRFKGLYKLNTEKSNETLGLVWERIETRVKTYEQNK